MEKVKRKPSQANGNRALYMYVYMLSTLNAVQPDSNHCLYRHYECIRHRFVVSCGCSLFHWRVMMMTTPRVSYDILHTMHEVDGGG